MSVPPPRAPDVSLLPRAGRAPSLAAAEPPPRGRATDAVEWVEQAPPGGATELELPADGAVTPDVDL